MNFIKIMTMSVIIFLNGCAAMPELFKAVDNIATDDAITIKVDRDAIKKETDVYINVRVLNKDEKIKQP